MIYAGEANNLHGAGNRFPEAAQKHKAEYLYTRLNVSGASRSDELQDIVAALKPAMNKGE